MLKEGSKPKGKRPPPGRCLSNLDSSSFEEGTLRPLSKCLATLKQGAAGEVRTLLPQWFDLPGRSEFKITLHFA